MISFKMKKNAKRKIKNMNMMKSEIKYLFFNQ